MARIVSHLTQAESGAILPTRFTILPTKEALMDWMVRTAAESVKAMFIRVGQAFPRVAVAVLIFLAGWLIARGVKWAVVKALKVVSFDDLAEKIHVNEFLRRGD